MSFWGGFAKGLGDQLDRGQRQKEFAETLKQRRLETLISVRAQREANFDFDNSPVTELYKSAEPPKPEDVADLETETATPEEPAEDVEGEELVPSQVDTPETPKVPPTATAEEATTETLKVPPTATAEGAKPRSDAGLDAYAGGLLYLGVSEDQLAQVLAKGGKQGVKFVYDTLVKNANGRPYSKAELSDALDSFIVSIEKGGTIDDLKLWRELFPEAGDPSEADLSYLRATSGKPKPRTSMTLPYFDTVDRSSKKPLTSTDVSSLRSDLVKQTLPALKRELSALRAEYAETQDPKIFARIKELDEQAIPLLEKNEDFETAMKFIGDEAGLALLSPYFEKYPELIDDPLFRTSGVGRFADAFKAGGFPDEEEEGEIPSFASEEEVRAAVASGRLTLPATVRVNGRIADLN